MNKPTLRELLDSPPEISSVLYNVWLHALLTSIVERLEPCESQDSSAASSAGSGGTAGSPSTPTSQPSDQNEASGSPSSSVVNTVHESATSADSPPPVPEWCEKGVRQCGGGVQLRGATPIPYLQVSDSLAFAMTTDINNGLTALRANRDWWRKRAEELRDNIEEMANSIELEIDKEAKRWQDRIDCLVYARCPQRDGSGCDSGDPLDLTMAELHQMLNWIDEQKDSRISKLENELAAANNQIDTKVKESEKAWQRIRDLEAEKAKQMATIDALRAEVERLKQPTDWRASCRVVRRGERDWDVVDHTGKWWWNPAWTSWYLLPSGVAGNLGYYRSESAARDALAACPTPPPTWKGGKA